MHSTDLCIFCLRDDGGFKSSEHIVPESLGNKSDTLPPGVVCDRCNNGPLSACDQALISCPPIAILKTTQRIRSKKGRPPRAESDGVSLFALDGDEDNIYLRILDEEQFRDGDGELGAITVSSPYLIIGIPHPRQS